MTYEPLPITAFLAAGTGAEQVRELLRDVIDPELGVDIVSLGLVYGLPELMTGARRRAFGWS